VRLRRGCDWAFGSFVLSEFISVNPAGHRLTEERSVPFAIPVAPRTESVMSHVQIPPYADIQSPLPRALHGEKSVVRFFAAAVAMNTFQIPVKVNAPALVSESESFNSPS
jgi:hypothetical protein